MDANALGRSGVKGSGRCARPNALAPLGVEHLDMPATAERVWRAIRAARGIGAENPT